MCTNTAGVNIEMFNGRGDATIIIRHTYYFIHFFVHILLINKIDVSLKKHFPFIYY